MDFLSVKYDPVRQDMARQKCGGKSSPGWLMMINFGASTISYLLLWGRTQQLVKVLKDIRY